MAPLFPWPGRLLKETPIREASISGVRPRGHAQVRLLFMSAKPIKTLQPTSLTPTRLALWQTEEEFLLELKSQSATNSTTASTCPSHSVLKWRVVSLSERSSCVRGNNSKLALTGTSAPAPHHQPQIPPPPSPETSSSGSSHQHTQAITKLSPVSSPLSLSYNLM